jgi:signal transduction histidine kinase
MKPKPTTNPTGQLRWVVLLLGMAVVLPTVCLLWFMSSAVKNERLAMLQKLKGIYQNRLDEAAAEKLGFENINSHLALVMSDGFLVFDSNDELFFPAADLDNVAPNGDTFSLAHEFEYSHNDPNRALAEYRLIAKTTDSNNVHIMADIGYARCLRKLNHLDQAIVELRTIISKYDDSDSLARTHKCRARVMLLDLYYQTDNKNLLNELSDTYDYVMDAMTTDNDLVWLGRKPQTNHYIPSSLQLFVLDRFIYYARNIKDEPSIKRKYKRASWFASVLNTSILAAQRYPAPSFKASNGVVDGAVFRLDTQEHLYGVYRIIDGYLHLMIYNQPHITEWLEEYLDDVEKLPSLCRIYDETDTLVAGSMITDRQPFIKAPLDSDYFPGWTVEMYIENSAYEDAARKQIAIYIWTGILVIFLILATGAIAIQAIGRQIKLNRLKNDFIATVTHELKTPLASTRVLVDTLLDGKYQDEQLTREYLQLMAKENARLSRLIDNFLTFSRMERNKRALDFQPARPAALVADAAEAVKTKFSDNHCNLELETTNHLPEIIADHDALVTVLVNLLDNACKYTHEKDKQITLKTFSRNDKICFQVTDNGVGMSKRTIRKIFQRFYQADQSLSRPAQGCGLGLAIVKFIIDAHHGDITVNSRPGQGTTFTVSLPRVV